MPGSVDVSFTKIISYANETIEVDIPGANRFRHIKAYKGI